MKFRRPLISKITAPVLACVLLVTAGGAVASAATGPSVPLPVPNPAADPFYAQPASFAGEQPGQVLASRAVSVVGLSAAFRAYQVQYVSTDTFGASQADVATILTPAVVSGPPKLVSYQAPIDSLSYNCDPSYELRIGTEEEIGMIGTLLLRGWTVVVPDFLGPDHQWAAGDVEAHGTLDGIRAAENFAPAALGGAATPVGMTGYSGGARGTEFANELAPTYAPELNIVGAASGGLAVDVADVMKAADGGAFAGVYFAAFFGLGRAYPAIGVDALLNAKGRQLKRDIGAMCIDQYTVTYALQNIETYTVNGINPLLLNRFRTLSDQIRGGRYGVPKAPTYLYMATNDELVIPANADQLIQQYCAAHLVVQYVKIPGDHVSTLATGFPGAVAWLADRFAGRPAPDTC